MSVERELTTHLSACLTSDDAGCIPAFVDRLMESWDQAVREDAEFFADSDGHAMPVLTLRCGNKELVIDFRHNPDGPPTEIKLAAKKKYQGTNRGSSTTVNDFLPLPPSWTFEDTQKVAEHIAWLRA